MRCDACGYNGAPSSDVLSALREAAAVVARSPIEARQLSDSIKRALGSGNSYRRRFTWIFAVCTAPVVIAALLFAIGQAVSSDDLNGVLIAFSLAMVIETALLGVLGRAILARRQRLMEDACAARPPASPGEPTTCHICGAPLIGHAEAFVRCGFCAADNLVAPSVLARVRGVLSPWFGSQVATVEAALAGMREVNRGATALMLVGALGVPPFVLVQFVVGVLVAQAYGGRGLDTSARYTVIKTPAGDCIGRVQAAGGNTTVIFGLWRPPGLPEEMHVPTTTVRAFSITKLKGKRVRSYRGDTGKVQGVLGSPLTGNSVKITSGGVQTVVAVTGVCLAPGEKSP
jgi:hypothetical protein